MDALDIAGITMNSKLLRISTFLLLVLTLGNATLAPASGEHASKIPTPQYPKPEHPIPQNKDSKLYRGGITKIGNLYISGQPMTAGALADLKKAGVNTVINLRTEEEMNNKKSTPIDEEQVLENLDLKYDHIPSGGEKHPFSPATLDQFTKAYESTDGNVLLHCNSGARATHIWVAYLIKEKGVPVDQALELGRAIRFSHLPIEGYLEGDYKLTFEKTGD